MAEFSTLSKSKSIMPQLLFKGSHSRRAPASLSQGGDSGGALPSPRRAPPVRLPGLAAAGVRRRRPSGGQGRWRPGFSFLPSSLPRGSSACSIGAGFRRVSSRGAFGGDSSGTGAGGSFLPSPDLLSPPPGSALPGGSPRGEGEGDWVGGSPSSGAG